MVVEYSPFSLLSDELLVETGWELDRAYVEALPRPVEAARGRRERSLQQRIEDSSNR